MNTIKKENIKQGLIMEKKLLRYLKKEDKNWRKTKDKYNIIDFRNKDKKIVGELKSRNYNNKDCQDWLIGKNKIERAKELYLIGYKIIFYFAFYDGIWSWEYTPEKIKTDASIRSGGRVDRGVNEIKDYYYIINEKLNFLTNKIKVKKIDPFEECLI